MFKKISKMEHTPNIFSNIHFLFLITSFSFEWMNDAFIYHIVLFELF